jgi:hypothetical protein
MNKLLVESFEVIDFQRQSRLIADMAMQLATAQKDPSKETFGKVSKALHKIAKEVTGIHFNFHFIAGQGFNAFVIPPQANSANPMRSDVEHSNLQRRRQLSEKEVFKGTVDIKAGKVSGIYSQIPIDIFMSVDFFNDHRVLNIMQPEYIAAILAHEMGHGFGFLRYMGMLTISNLVVREIVKTQQESGTEQAMVEVVKVVEQKTGWRIRDLGEINSSTDPLLIQQMVIAGMVDSIRSELGTKFFDRRAFEFTADQFVARHGGAHHLVKGMDVIYQIYPQYIREYRGRMGNIIASLFSYCTAAFAIGSISISGLLLGNFTAASVHMGAVAVASFGVIGLVVGSFLLLSVLFKDPDDGIYDPIPKRYDAMRRELIASSKEPTLTPNQRKEIIDQIAIIDSVVSKLSDASYFGVDRAVAWIYDVFSGRRGERRFQQSIEKLVNNRLFEVSNTLQANKV